MPTNVWGIVQECLDAIANTVPTNLPQCYYPEVPASLQGMYNNPDIRFVNATPTMAGDMAVDSAVNRRLAHCARLRRCITAVINLFMPNSLPGYLSEEKSVGRDLHIFRLLTTAGVQNPIEPPHSGGMGVPMDIAHG